MILSEIETRCLVHHPFERHPCTPIANPVIKEVLHPLT